MERESTVLGPVEHPPRCLCPSCTGRRNRRSGLAKQRDMFQALGIEARYWNQRSNEEQWGEAPDIPGIRWEAKSGKQCPAFLVKCFNQVEQQRAIGSLWKPGVVITPSNSTTAYAILRVDDLRNLCRSLAEVGRGHQVKTLLQQARRALDEAESLV